MLNTAGPSSMIFPNDDAALGQCFLFAKLLSEVVLLLGELLLW